MQARFKGEADGLPCTVFGQEFPAGEWVTVEGLAASKLPGNPMFETDGEAMQAAEPAKAPKGRGKAAERVPEPDPEADEAPPAAEPIS